MFYTYIIKSGLDGSYYKGMSASLEMRLKEHNSGRVRATKNHRPYILIYVHLSETIGEAREWEKFLKSGIGRETIKELNEIQRTW